MLTSVTFWSFFAVLFVIFRCQIFGNPIYDYPESVGCYSFNHREEVLDLWGFYHCKMIRVLRNRVERLEVNLEELSDDTRIEERIDDDYQNILRKITVLEQKVQQQNEVIKNQAQIIKEQSDTLNSLSFAIESMGFAVQKAKGLN